MTRGDAKAIAAKYGAKVRALMGGAPSVGRPATGAVKPPAPTVPKPPTAPNPPTAALISHPASSMEACWQALCEQNKGKPQAQMEADWFALVERVHPGKQQSDLAPVEWGAVMAAIRDDDPMPF